jgi:NAD(P)-dependent dehydrogenase (short-subunit alcohol dehydrogenase family)
MNVSEKIIIVTGGAHGIGKALCQRFVQEGAKVAIADLDLDAAQLLATELNALAVQCDVSNEDEIKKLVAAVEAHYGRVDVFCSNAGIALGEKDLATSASNQQWQKNWDIHVMAHVYAARAVLPAMIARGEGYFLQTASAAGLLAQIGDAAYTTTKHAAIGFAESLAISHGDDGIGVSVLCPQYVATQMIGMGDLEDTAELAPGILTAAEVADAVINGLAEKQFLILPHQEVERFRQNKAKNIDIWLAKMRKLRQTIMGTGSNLAI